MKVIKLFNRIKYHLLFSILFSFMLIIPIKLNAYNYSYDDNYYNINNILDDDDVIIDDEIDDKVQSYLARKLEELGVPVAIAGLITSLGVSAGLWFLTRAFRKKNNEIDVGLKSLNLTKDELNKVNNTINLTKVSLVKLQDDFKKDVIDFYDKTINNLSTKIEDLTNQLKAEKINTKEAIKEVKELLNNNIENIVEVDDEIDDLEDKVEV